MGWRDRATSTATPADETAPVSAWRARANSTPVPKEKPFTPLQGAMEAESQGIPLVKEKYRAGLSGLNKGLMSPLRVTGLSRLIGGALYPDMKPEDAAARVEFRNLAHERRAPNTAGFMSGLGTTPYTLKFPSQGAGFALQGAMSSSLLDDSTDPLDKFKAVLEGAATGHLAGKLPKVLGKAEDTFEKMSARQYYKASDASEAMGGVLREKAGSTYGPLGIDAGRAARNLSIPDEPPKTAFGRWRQARQEAKNAKADPRTVLPEVEKRVLGRMDNPEENLANLGKMEREYGPQIDKIAKEVDARKRGSVDVAAIDRRIAEEAAGMSSDPDSAFNAGQAGKTAQDLLEQYREHIRQTKQASTDIAYPEPMQGDLGIRSQELVPGPETVMPPPRQTGNEVLIQKGLPLTETSLHPGPDVTMPPPRQIGTEVEIQQGMPLNRTTGPEAAGVPNPTPAKFTADTPYVPPVREPVQREMFPAPMSSAVEGAPVRVQDPAIAQSVGVERDMFGTARDTVIPGNPVMTQDPAIGQTVARQGNFQNDPNFPPREPVTRGNTNLWMDMEEALGYKRWLQKRAFELAQIKNPIRPQAAIDASPELQFMQRISSIFKDETENAVLKHHPDAYSPFMKANQKVHDSMLWLPTIQGNATRFAGRGAGLSLSNLANRRLLTGLTGIGGLGIAAAGNTSAGLGLTGAAVGAEVLGNFADKYGHSLSATLLRDLQAKAGVLKNPAIPRLFIKSMTGMRNQEGEDPNAPSE